MDIHGIFQARVLEWGAIAFSPDIENRLSIAIREKDEEEWTGSLGLADIK